MNPSEPSALAAPRRNPLGIAFAVAAVAFLLIAGYCLTRAFGTAAPVTPAGKSEKDEGRSPAKVIPLDKESGADAEAGPKVPYGTEFAFGGVVGILCALATGVGAARLLGAPSKPEDHGTARANALLLFTVGAVVGGALLLSGFALFYVWFAELGKWLAKEDAGEPLKPLLAVLLFVVGAAVLFAAVQPLRSQERHDVVLRRIVYGTNFLLTTLLLIVALIFVNVLASRKLPERFDATAQGFYTLSPTTRDHLAGMERDIVITTTIQEGAEGTDILRVLGALRDANPKRIKLKQLSLTLDKSEIAALKGKYPAAEIVDEKGRMKLGAVVALGPDEKRYQFISIAELSTEDPRTGRRTLVTEPRMVREILFLGESQQKPVVYFTQDAGEIAIERPNPGQRIPNARSGEQIKQALVAENCEVRTLRIDPQAAEPKIPDDAAMVVVADPTAKLGPAVALALKGYMTKARGESKGKLLVLAGAHPDDTPQRRVLEIGIEDLLADFGIVLAPQILYSAPKERVAATTTVGEIFPPAIQSRNTIALNFSNRIFIANNCRPVMVDPREQGPRCLPLIATPPGRDTWLEPVVVRDPKSLYDNLILAQKLGRKDVLETHAFGSNRYALAAVASDADTGTARVVVFGYGDFADEAQSDEEGRMMHAELFAASANWLRDRPAVSNEGNKQYGTYTPNPKFDWTRGVTLPVVLVILGISAAGMGLWVLRRR